MNAPPVQGVSIAHGHRSTYGFGRMRVPAFLAIALISSFVPRSAEAQIVDPSFGIRLEVGSVKLVGSDLGIELTISNDSGSDMYWFPGSTTTLSFSDGFLLAHSTGFMYDEYRKLVLLDAKPVKIDGRSKSKVRLRLALSSLPRVPEERVITKRLLRPMRTQYGMKGSEFSPGDRVDIKMIQVVLTMFDERPSSTGYMDRDHDYALDKGFTVISVPLQVDLSYRYK